MFSIAFFTILIGDYLENGSSGIYLESLRQELPERIVTLYFSMWGVYGNAPYNIFFFYICLFVLRFDFQNDLK